MKHVHIEMHNKYKIQFTTLLKIVYDLYLYTLLALLLLPTSSINRNIKKSSLFSVSRKKLTSYKKKSKCIIFQGKI